MAVRLIHGETTIMKRSFILLSLAFTLVGCQAVSVYSPAESESGYTYVPLDPFPVTPKQGTSCRSQDTLSRKTLLESLPDNAVRMLTERFDASGAVTYGPSKVGGAGESYRVTIDYIYSDTINRQVWISKTVTAIWDTDNVKGKTERRMVPIGSIPDFTYVPGSETYKITSHRPPIGENPEQVKEREVFDKEYMEYSVPVYVGVGLRVAANIYAAKGYANISGLGIIGAEAEANNLKGSLIIQTLGVNGKSVAAALPIQSELNRTTAQNAIVAIGTIKALLHAPETLVAPRVVGLYLPFPGGKALVNALISELSKTEIPWEYNCFSRSRPGEE